MKWIGRGAGLAVVAPAMVLKLGKAEAKGPDIKEFGRGIECEPRACDPNPLIKLEDVGVAVEYSDGTTGEEWFHDKNIPEPDEYGTISHVSRMQASQDLTVGDLMTLRYQLQEDCLWSGDFCGKPGETVTKYCSLYCSLDLYSSGRFVRAGDTLTLQWHLTVGGEP